MAKKANETGNNTATVVKPTNGNGNGSAKAAKTEVKNIEVPELQKQIAAMQKQFETLKSENEQLKQRKQISLSERLELTDKLNQLIANREKFLSVRDSLDAMPENQNPESFEFEETNDFRLTLTDNNQHTEVFSISNVYVIDEAKKYLFSKISGKVAEIEQEIKTLDI